MSSGWLDEVWESELGVSEDSTGSFYCPYTNTAVCALLAKGWQPQELCRDIDCEQLRFVRPKMRRQKRAA